MGMSNTRLGTALATTFKNFGTGLDPEEKISDAQLIQLWQDAAQDIIDEINFADITLQAGDVPIPAAGLIDSQAGAVTGAAQSAITAALTGRIS